MNFSDRLVGSPLGEGVKHFHETRLVKNHTWGIGHLVEPSRDVGFAGRRESVAEARCTCGFGETWQLVPVRRK